MLDQFSVLWETSTLTSMVLDDFTFTLAVFRGFFSPYLPQHLLLLVFLMTTTLTRRRWNVDIILICISLTANEVEYFYFIYLSTLWISSFEKCLFSSVAHWLTGLLDFLLFCLLNSLYILTPTRCIAGKDFIPFCIPSLHSLAVSFAV